MEHTYHTEIIPFIFDCDVLLSAMKPQAPPELYASLSLPQKDGPPKRIAGRGIVVTRQR